jgi:superfamily II DNA or RNA helicase
MIMTARPLFSDLSLPRVIDTSSTDFMSEFYNPLLSRATEYRRGVGYFTTNWVQSAARGISELAENGGSCYWIVSPKLEEDDWEALRDGEQARRDEVLKESLDASISNLRYDLEYKTRNAVAWMIADGLLEIRLAVPTGTLSGDFHDKFGVFTDSEGNRVSFHGSQNDSRHALSNYEAYTIDCSWVSEREMEAVEYQERRFNRLWNGEDPNVNVYSVPDASKEKIVELRDQDHRPYEAPEQTSLVEGGITLREYQRSAIDAWFANDCRGLFQMATGTGKTFTALAALDEYLDSLSGSTLSVIAVPQKHLAKQWADEMDVFGLQQPKFVYGSANPDWKRDLSRLVNSVKLGNTDHACLVTTHTTLANEYFRDKIDGLKENSILIADEVHGLGSEYQREGLMESYDARIGLSATPERYYDEEGSNHLLKYFDGTVFEYSLQDAIPEYLTPYRYYPVFVEMDEEELEEYRQLTQSVGAAHGDDDVPDEVVQILQSKRASIVKRAIRKYDALRDILSKIDDPNHLIVYTNTKQISAVADILDEYGIIHHKFTYKEDDERRDKLLKGFEDGLWDALVAMKCLDEGVNIPATRTAILMSNSGNPMQFVQRRGRVLRKSPGKETAVIYDMIVVPSMDPDRSIVESEKNILKKEIRRFEEFADAAKNGHAARNKLEDIRIKYGI